MIAVPSVQDWPKGTEVIVHTAHTFLRVFDGKHGEVVCPHDGLVEVAFDHFTADFQPEELEVAGDDKESSDG